MFGANVIDNYAQILTGLNRCLPISFSLLNVFITAIAISKAAISELHLSRSHLILGLDVIVVRIITFWIYVVNHF